MHARGNPAAAALAACTAEHESGITRSSSLAADPRVARAGPFRFGPSCRPAGGLGQCHGLARFARPGSAVWRAVARPAVVTVCDVDARAVPTRAWPWRPGEAGMPCIGLRLNGVVWRGVTGDTGGLL